MSSMEFKLDYYLCMHPIYAAHSAADNAAPAATSYPARYGGILICCFLRAAISFSVVSYLAFRTGQMMAETSTAKELVFWEVAAVRLLVVVVVFVGVGVGLVELCFVVMVWNELFCVLLESGVVAIFELDVVALEVDLAALDVEPLGFVVEDFPNVLVVVGLVELSKVGLVEDEADDAAAFICVAAFVIEEVLLMALDFETVGTMELEDLARDFELDKTEAFEDEAEAMRVEEEVARDEVDEVTPTTALLLVGEDDPRNEGRKISEENTWLTTLETYRIEYPRLLSMQMRAKMHWYSCLLM